MSALFISSTSTFYVVVSGNAAIEYFVSPMNLSLNVSTSSQMATTSVQPQWTLTLNASYYQGSSLTFSAALPVNHSNQGALFAYSLVYTLTGQTKMANATSGSVALDFYSLFSSAHFVFLLLKN